MHINLYVGRQSSHAFWTISLFQEYQGKHGLPITTDEYITIYLEVSFRLDIREISRALPSSKTASMAILLAEGFAMPRKKARALVESMLLMYRRARPGFCQEICCF